MSKPVYILSVAVATLTFSCNSPEGKVERDTLKEATEDTAVVYDDEKGRIEAEGAEIKTFDEGFWNNVNWDAPVVDDPEMKRNEVETRSDERQTIFTLEDRLLFDTDKAEIRKEGQDKLKAISDKIKNDYPNAQIRIFGHADARASNEYNKELSRSRAEAVRNWLQNNGNIDEGRLSIEAMGETDPRATNETAKGRQLNRRVAIVVARQQQ